MAPSSGSASSTPTMRRLNSSAEARSAPCRVAAVVRPRSVPGCGGRRNLTVSPKRTAVLSCRAGSTRVALERRSASSSLAVSRAATLRSSPAATAAASASSNSPRSSSNSASPRGVTRLGSPSGSGARATTMTSSCWASSLVKARLTARRPPPRRQRRLLQGHRQRLPWESRLPWSQSRWAPPRRRPGRRRGTAGRTA